MKTKKERLDAICDIIQTKVIRNQEDLLKQLNTKGFTTTQATLSRDIKQLKVAKTHDGKDNYIYSLPENGINLQQKQNKETPDKNQTSLGYANIEFSGNLAVVKTKPGYAMAIASDIDAKAPREILATVAGDDTILLIPREGISRNDIIKALSLFVPEIITNEKRNLAR